MRAAGRLGVDWPFVNNLQKKKKKTVDTKKKKAAHKHFHKNCVEAF